MVLYVAGLSKWHMHGELNTYTKTGYKTVDGWLNLVALHAIVQFSNIQKEESIAGPVCEIGVHHGRLFILLHLLTRSEEWSVAWDLFENQCENPFDSGRGDLQKFKENLARFGCDLNRISIYTKNSLALNAAEAIEACGGNPRLFSVDGGHTADITYNDIQIAAKSICDCGIIILDDFFNEAWPGVAEGASKYLIENNDLYPIAILGNKVMLTNSPEAADMYLNRFELAEPGYIIKRTEFYSREVICMVPLNTNVIWKYLRDKPAGRFFRKIREYISR